MILQSLILIISTLILCTPLLFWMYLSIVLPENTISRIQFLFGICIGGITTIPFLLNDFLPFGGFFHIFESLALGQYINVGIYITIFLGIMMCLIYGLKSFFFIFKKYTGEHDYFLKNILGIFGIVLLGMLCILGGEFILGGLIAPESVFFGTLAFVTYGAVIGYYFIISVLEESMKYIGASGVSRGGKNIAVFMVSVALGFAFFENILYAIQYILNTGIQNGLLGLVFFRSVFTVILHIGASLILAVAFQEIIQGAKIYFRVLRKFIFFSFIALTYHALYDITITFGYIGFVLLYLLGIYYILSYVFTQDLRGVAYTASQ